MSDLREAAEMALDYIRREGWTNPQGKEVWLALRQALAQPEQVLTARVVVTGEKPPVKTYCGGKPNYCTPEVTPEVTTEVTGDVDAVNTSQESVDETAKRKHEPVAWMYTSHYKGNEWFITRDQSELTTYKADKVQPLYTAPSKREWVVLTDEEIGWIWHNSPSNSHEYARAIEAKLKEKNTF